MDTGLLALAGVVLGFLITQPLGGRGLVAAVGCHTIANFTPPTIAEIVASAGDE